MMRGGRGRPVSLNEPLRPSHVVTTKAVTKQPIPQAYDGVWPWALNAINIKPARANPRAAQRAERTRSQVGGPTSASCFGSSGVIINHMSPPGELQIPRLAAWARTDSGPQDNSQPHWIPLLPRLCH